MRLEDQVSKSISSSRREFLGAAALVFAGIGRNRLAAHRHLKRVLSIHQIRTYINLA